MSEQRERLARALETEKAFLGDAKARLFEGGEGCEFRSLHPRSHGEDIAYHEGRVAALKIALHIHESSGGQP